MSEIFVILSSVNTEPTEKIIEAWLKRQQGVGAAGDSETSEITSEFDFFDCSKIKK